MWGNSRNVPWGTDHKKYCTVNVYKMLICYIRNIDDDILSHPCINYCLRVPSGGGGLNMFVYIGAANNFPGGGRGAWAWAFIHPSKEISITGMKYLPPLWIYIFQWTKFNRIFKTWQKERFSVRLRSLRQSVKGTVSPDYKCLEVVSVKSPWLGHVTPDIKNNLSFPLIS